jgi:hypothetical protein
VPLRYLERSPIVVPGAVSGRRYPFSATSPVQHVDARDAGALLRSGFFRRI